jgi:hypothetical protein
MNKMNPSEDDDLRERLREQGEAIARRAPSFQRTWRAAQAAGNAPVRSTSLAWMRWAFATAAIACAALVTTLSIHLPGAHDTPKQEVTAKPAIQTGDNYSFDPSAPTDFLLADRRDITTPPSVDQLTREINALLNP